jgi:hypothetical protein
VAAYLGDEGIVTVDRETLQNTIIEVIILGSLKRGIEVAHSLENKTPIHHRRYVDRATAQQLEVRVIPDPKLLPPRHNGTISRDLAANPGDEGTSGMRL